MEKIYNYTLEHPNKDIVGSEVTRFNIEFYHIVSLLIDNKKHTKEFLIWKTQCALEDMAAALIDYDSFANVVCRKFYENWARLKQQPIGEVEIYSRLNIVELTTTRIENIIEKLILLFLLLQKEGISYEEVIAKY